MSAEAPQSALRRGHRVVREAQADALWIDEASRQARHSSESVDHFTPHEFVDAARKTMGAIDLDPASCHAAQAVVKAKRYFTALEDNGFVQAWRGRVFLNPPGGKCDARGLSLELGGKKPLQSSGKAWWRKLQQEFDEGRVKEAVFVGYSLELLQTTQVDATGRTPLDFPCCYPSRRVCYLTSNPRGELVPGNSPTHSSFFCYLGDHTDAFESAFHRFGKIVVPR